MCKPGNAVSRSAAKVLFGLLSRHALLKLLLASLHLLDRTSPETEG
jgi:hypothetical protein